jgi:predicted RNase H-like HicB family nuclease
MSNQLETEKNVAAETAESPRPIAITIHVTVTALAFPEKDGGYSLSVPALEGCYSQAESLEEAEHNIQEAAQGWLEARHDYEVSEGNVP